MFVFTSFIMSYFCKSQSNDEIMVDNRHEVTTELHVEFHVICTLSSKHAQSKSQLETGVHRIPRAFQLAYPKKMLSV